MAQIYTALQLELSDTDRLRQIAARNGISIPEGSSRPDIISMILLFPEGPDQPDSTVREMLSARAASSGGDTSIPESQKYSLRVQRIRDSQQ